MIEIGKYNKLTVEKLAEPGAFLSDGMGNSVLLPNRYFPNNLSVNDEIDVFVYKDSENRPVATTETPRLILHEFGVLKVKDTTSYGVFMDWGLSKDLLIPHSEQDAQLETGKSYLVYLYLDEMSERLVGSTKLSKYLDSERVPYEAGDEVEIIIWKQTNLGRKVIIDQQYQGMIYANEIFQSVRLGDRLKGYIKLVREDGKVDVSLQPQGYQNIEPNAQRILNALKEGNGFLALHDKSDPQEIKNELGMSKKVFKKAIGSLYKQKLITLSDGGIKLS